MKRKLQLISVMIVLINVCALHAQEVVINEVMSSNTNVIADEDGEYQDWVELYNAGPQAVNLQGYGLSDDQSIPFKWVFPARWLQPGQHLLVWCSDKNRSNPAMPLHSNFRISASGEIIQLTPPNGLNFNTYPAQNIPDNFSHGRQADGGATLVFFPQPTPNATNSTSGFSQILAPPVFSTPGGFFTNTFQLNLSHPDPEATIIYTTDGSDPDWNNLNGTTYVYKNQYPYGLGQLPINEFFTNSFSSKTYTSPITITNRTNEPNDISAISSTFDFDPSYYLPDFPVYKGTVVRARAFKNGALSSTIVTHSYFVFPEGNQKFTLPVVSLSLSENKFFDYFDGIYVAGVDYDNWRVQNPDITPLYYSESNYDRSGDETEQEGHFNYFVNGQEVLNQKIGIRMNGGGSRGFQSKSLRLYARSEYGNSTFNYPMFSGENYNSYKRLILRNSGNDFFNTYYKDAFTHELIEKTGLDNQAYQPTVVFLNGEYWGMLNLRERLDRHYFEQKYGIGEQDIEIISDGYRSDEGSDEAFESLYTFMENNTLADNANFEYIKTLMDIDNFRDYFITNIYIQNTDWPGWNTLFWRKKGAYNPQAAYGTDGRWRTAIKDTDASFGLMYDINDHNTLAFATATGGTEWPNPEWSTLLLRRLLENPSFQLSFINRFADMMNTYFLPSRVIQLSDFYGARIQQEIGGQIERWDAPSSWSWWNESQDVIETFAAERPVYQREHIREKFGIEGDITVTLQVNEPGYGYIKINTIDIKSTTPGVSEAPYPWSGVYFQNIPVTLKAIPMPGYVFSHWSGASSSTHQEVTITSNTDVSITAHFIPDGEIQEEGPLYFWMFDTNVPNDQPLTNLNSTFEVPSEGSLQYQSCLTGYPFTSSHPNWRKASMERRNSPTPLNYIPEANNNIPFATSNMRGIQIKQPFQNGTKENSLIFNVSTANFKDIKFAFAAKNELAAEAIVVEYSSVSGTPNWTTVGLTQSSFPLTAAYQLFNVDFSTLEAVENNANFKVRLRFTGTNMTEDLGNRVTFNNFSVLGTSLGLGTQDNIKNQFVIFPNPTLESLNVAYTLEDAVSYKIYSFDGKLIQQGVLDLPNIDVSALQSGVYIVELASGGISEVKKFIKR